MSKYQTIKLTVRGMNKHLGTQSEERCFFSVGSVCDQVLEDIHRTQFKYWPNILLVSVEETV